MQYVHTWNRDIKETVRCQFADSPREGHAVGGNEDVSGRDEGAPAEELVAVISLRHLSRALVIAGDIIAVFHIVFLSFCNVCRNQHSFRRPCWRFLSRSFQDTCDIRGWCCLWKRRACCVAKGYRVVVEKQTRITLAGEETFFVWYFCPVPAHDYTMQSV